MAKHQQAQIEGSLKKAGIPEFLAEDVAGVYPLLEPGQTWERVFDLYAALRDMEDKYDRPEAAYRTMDFEDAVSDAHTALKSYTAPRAFLGSSPEEAMMQVMRDLADLDIVLTTVNDKMELAFGMRKNKKDVIPEFSWNGGSELPEEDLDAVAFTAELSQRLFEIIRDLKEEYTHQPGLHLLEELKVLLEPQNVQTLAEAFERAAGDMPGAGRRVACFRNVLDEEGSNLHRLFDSKIEGAALNAVRQGIKNVYAEVLQNDFEILGQKIREAPIRFSEKEANLVNNVHAVFSCYLHRVDTLSSAREK